MRRESARRDGVILLLIAGAMTLFILLGLLLLSVARGAARRADALLASSRAGLAADSGMAYAFARLSQDTLPPGDAGPGGRGDDWAARDSLGTFPDRLLNPSYSHAEAWLDNPSGREGAFEPSIEAPASDADGDGRFAPRSGRLRGGTGAFATTFLLQVESTEGKIPLNAGRLSLPGDPDPMAHRSDAIPYHRSIARTIDNLGAMVGVSCRRGTYPTSGEGLLVSWIGTDLIRNRPPGGYRSWEQVERTLRALPASPYLGDPYTAADYAAAAYLPEDVGKIRPFVDLGPYEPMSGGSLAARTEGEHPPDYVPISLRSAPLEVLKAVWMYLGAVNPADQADFAGETAGGDKPSTGAGGLFREISQILFPGEAEALAREAMGFRRGRELTWQALRDRLIGRAEAIFARDFADLGGSPDTSFYRRGWVAAKASLACEAVCVDPPSGLFVEGPLSFWAGKGIDLSPDPGVFQGVPVRRWESRASDGMTICSSFFAAARPGRFDPALPSLGVSPYQRIDPCSPFVSELRPQGFTLAPPVRFSVLSRGAEGGVSSDRAGRLRAAERLELSSQEDFEALLEDAAAAAGRETPLARRGIFLVADLSSAERFDCSDPGGLDPAVVSVPRFPWRGIGRTVDPSLPPYPENVLKAPYHGFTGGPGGVTLAAVRDLAPEGARLTWKLPLDHVVEDRSVAGTEHRELLSGWDPVYYKVEDPPYSPPPHPPDLPPSFRHWWPGERIQGYPLRIAPSGCGPHAVEGTSVCKVPGWHAVDETYTPQPGWPGMLPRTRHDIVRDFAWNGWMGPSSAVRIAGGAASIAVETRRGSDAGDPAKAGTFFSLKVAAMWTRYLHWDRFSNPRKWLWWDGNPLVKSEEKLLQDGASPPAGWRFVHLRCWGELEGGGGWRWCSDFTNTAVPSTLVDRAWITHFQLFVDGSLLLSMDFWEPAGATALERSGGLWTGWDQSVNVSGADDLRFYDSAVASPPVPPGDRSLRSGTFRSPRYASQPPLRLRQAQWEGVFPNGAKDRMSVLMEGFNASGAAVADVPLGVAGANTDLAAQGFPREVASFRYRVVFDESEVSGSLREPPVFESIRLTMQRRGISPAWTSYGQDPH